MYYHITWILFLLQVYYKNIFTLFFEKIWFLKHKTPHYIRRRGRRKRLKRPKYFSNYLKQFNWALIKSPSFSTLITTSNNIILRRCVKTTFKSLFHFKLLFNLKEFYVYDYYNFYSTIFSNNSYFRKKKDRQYVVTQWHKLRFFYHLKLSLLICLRHTLSFLKVLKKTQKKLQAFTVLFKPATVLGYMWFFEYNILTLLMKLNFSSSIPESLNYFNIGIIRINGVSIFQKWSIIQPSDIIQIIITRLFLLKFKIKLFWLLGFLTKMKNYYRYFYHYKRRLMKPQRTIKYGSLFNIAKFRHFKYIEVDYRTFSAIFLILKNLIPFYQYLFMLWFNYWNYRTLGWKLVT